MGICKDNKDYDDDKKNHKDNNFQTENDTWVVITREFQLTSL